MGIFVAMETYVTFFGSIQFFANFRSRFQFFINQPYHINNIQNSENFQMTLTFDLYLTLILTFDLDDLKKYIFFNFFYFFLKSRDAKTDGRIQNRRSFVSQPEVSTTSG